MCSVQSKYTQNNNSVIKKINQIENEVKQFLPSSKDDVDSFKIKYLGKNGVLMRGGVLKRQQKEITSLSEIVKSTGDKIIAGFNKNDDPAPVIDMLGLTESINVFIGCLLYTSPSPRD